MARHNGGHPAGKAVIELNLMSDETLEQLIMGAFLILSQRHEMSIEEVIEDCLEGARDATD